MKPGFLGIRMRLTLTIGAFFLIMMAMFFSFLYPRIRLNISNSEKEKIKIYATSVATKLDKDLQKAIIHLKSIASLNAIRSLERKRIDYVLSNLDSTSQSFIFYQVINKSGYVIARPSKPERVGRDRSEREYYKHTISKNKTHVCHMQVSPAMHYTLNVGTPIRNKKGDIQGILVGSMGLADRNPDMYQSILEPIVPDGWEVFLVSEKGFLIAHSHRAIEGIELNNLDFSSHPSIRNAFRNIWGAENFEYKRQRWYATSTRVPLTDWTVVVQVPETLILSHVDAVTKPLAVFAGIFLIILLGAGLLVAGHFIGPLERLTSSLRRYGEKGEVDLVEVKGSDEIATALHAFNKMITDRKKADSELRESEERYRHLVENANEAIFIIEDGIVKFPNLKTEEMTGYSEKELSEIPFENIIHPDDREMVLERRRKRLLGEKLPSTYSFRMINKSGGELLVQINTVLINWEGNPATINFIRDITEQKRLEDQLQQAQKMESLGLLAGGVAHDLNNVLAGIVSYPELLLLDLPEDSKLRKPVETMQESGHRAAAIVQDLLTVARGVATTKEPLNLNDVVSDYLNSPEFKKLKQFHPSVTIKINLNSNLLNITGSHVHIRKVVMNLVSNASEAIEGSGNVIISTMNRYIDRPLRGYGDVTIGEYAVLAVSDDGPGISPDDLERIFDPFYTKKVMGRSGTGLGLTVVWNVIQDHEGYIDVKSDENGTTFELYFPITRDEVSDKGLSIPIKDYKGDGETVLVVDDVESQREIACEMLNTLGYKAKAVSSGEEAVEYLKEHTVDLILLDMIMDPGINGCETYERIIKIHPNQKAIIASGFAETDDVKEAQRLGAGQYIKKPLTLEKIGIAVKDELTK